MTRAVLLVPAPAEQTQPGEAGGEEWERGWKGNLAQVVALVVIVFTLVVVV